MRHLAYTLVTNNTQNAISGMTDGHTLRHASAVKHVKLAQSPPFSQKSKNPKIRNNQLSRLYITKFLL